MLRTEATLSFILLALIRNINIRIYNTQTAGAYAGGFQGFPETPPDSESLPFYVLAMQTLLRKAEIIFNTVASRCVRMFVHNAFVYRSAIRPFPITLEGM